MGGRIGPGDEQPVAAAYDGIGDCDDLFGRLALAEHDFGKALAVRPAVIDAGKLEVFDRRRKDGFGLARGVRRIKNAVTHGAASSAVSPAAA